MFSFDFTIYFDWSLSSTWSLLTGLCLLFGCCRVARLTSSLCSAKWGHFFTWLTICDPLACSLIFVFSAVLSNSHVLFVSYLAEFGA